MCINESDLISVIVPVYNMEQYLERCVNSITGQSYKNLEIILVDDGSSDKSAQMCDQYAWQDARIKVIHKANGGLSDARNAGLLIAQGAYIGYVDSDDWIEPQMYEKLYKACKRYEAQVAVCRYARVYQDETYRDGQKKVTVFDREGILKAYLADSEEYIIYNSVWSKLFAREVVEEDTFPVGRNSEDIMYTTRAFCRVKKAVYIDECLYNYVLDREGSIMNVNRTDRMLRDEIPFWQAHVAYIRQNVSDHMGDMAAYYFYRRLLFYYTDLECNKATRKAAKRISEMMKKDKKEITRVYRNQFEGKGATLRMKVFLLTPKGYYIMNKCYEKSIVTFKNFIKMREKDAI